MKNEVGSLFISITTGLTIFTSFFAGQHACAQSSSWIPASEGLPSGPVRTIHKNANGLLVAGTFGGIYRYEGPAGWLLTEVADTPIQTISSAPNGTLFAISYEDSTFYRSANGVHWDSYRIDGLISGTVAAINDTLVYTYIQDSAACEPEKQGLRWHRSEDGGASWTCVTNTSDFWRSVRDLIVTRQGTLLAATTEGISRSEDGGWQWKAATDAAGDSLIADIFEFGGVSSSYVIAQNRPREMYLSKDDGKTWAHNSLTGYVEDLLLMENGTLFAALNEAWLLSGGVWTHYPGGVYRSLDDGLSWSLHNLDDGALTGIVQMDIDFFAASFSGMFRSTDQGASWVNDQRRLHNQWVIDIAVAPEQVVYASTYPRRLHRSVDRGASWTLLEMPPFDESILDYGDAGRLATPRFWELDVAPDGTIYAYDGNLLRSEDGGTTWEAFSVGFILEDLNINADGTLLAAGAASGIHRSVDRGASWSLVGDNPSDSYAVAADLVGGLYAGALFNISYLDPGASSWTTIDVPEYRVFDLAIDDEGRIYAGVQKYVDEDSLKSRVVSLPSPGLDRGRIDPMYVHPESSKRRPSYIAVDAGGVLRSEDQGRTWQHVGLDSVIVYALQTDLDGHVYAGPYRSEDGGDTWAFIGEGMSRTDVRALTIDPNSGYVYAGTYGGGLYRSSFQALVSNASSPPEARIALGPAFPNPYVQSRTGGFLRIPLILDRLAHLEIGVYDAQGKRIAVLADGHYSAGRHELHWEPAGVASGVYWIRLLSEKAQSTLPVLVIR